jgi:hypothetical protein
VSVCCTRWLAGRFRSDQPDSCAWSLPLARTMCGSCCRQHPGIWHSCVRMLLAVCCGAWCPCHRDVLFCHRPDPDTPIEETVRAMNWVVDQVGVTHVYSSMLLLCAPTLAL